MARKRNVEPDMVVSAGSTPARARRKSTHTKTAVTPVVPDAVAEPVLAEPVSQFSQPTYEEIARLAYTYWEARGCQGGSPEEDWLRAEQELQARRVASAIA